jgi:tetratricopeptide (TPR) repeat protein
MFWQMAFLVRTGLLTALVLGTALPGVAAQQSTIAEAFELERRGEYEAAVKAYRELLDRKPGDVSALLGLERVLLPLNRSAEILPEIRAGLAANPSRPALYGVALRAWAAVGRPDSMRAIAERWARLQPGDENPYREWGAAALAARQRDEALRAYRLGRERLGRPDALAGELAQLAVADGDYATAAREWVPAVRRLPGYRVTAVATLGHAPESKRAEILRMLAAEQDFIARRLESELRVKWGDPLGGLAALQRGVPERQGQVLDALRALVEQLRMLRNPDALLAQGRALEAIASRLPPVQASRTRLEAAQAYSAAGDRESARRMLSGLADDRSTPGTMPSGAAGALLTVLIDEGKLPEASRRLAELGPKMSGDERARLTRSLAAAYMRRGELDRADSTLGRDSTVEGFALAGRISLYRGDLKGAVDRFKQAGPYAGDRADATRRTVLLALLQPIEADTLPALGAALLELEQGDTARAVTELVAVADELPAARGGAEVRLLAGRLSQARGDPSAAERLYREAASREAPATAPAAELALAELMLDADRKAEAMAQLEHLILTYPESALVPQARRTLDQARGAVPRT